MRAVICGAGQVGFVIAERLAAEGNDVSVIGIQPRLIQSIAEAARVKRVEQLSRVSTEFFRREPAR